MAQIGRVRGARPGPVEVLCASVQEPSGMANAVCMVAIALVQGPRTVLRVSSFQKPHMGNLPQRSELLLGALPSKEDRCLKPPNLPINLCKPREMWSALY